MTIPDPPITPQHFFNCHPEDAHGPQMTQGYKPQPTEACWHCSTSTDQGCYCLTCVMAADDVPPGAVYHCRRCGRWWTYMVVTPIALTTFPDPS